MSTEQIAQNVVSGIKVLAAVAKTESKLIPYATFIAGFFPGAASVLSAIQIAQPYIDKAIAAAPVVETAISEGIPILEAIDNSGPNVLSSIKKAIAIYTNADPSTPETSMTENDVSDDEAAIAAGPIMFGRAWTAEETQRWFDQASGVNNRF